MSRGDRARLSALGRPGAQEPGKRKPLLACCLDLPAQLLGRQGETVQRVGIGAPDLA